MDVDNMRVERAKAQEVDAVMTDPQKPKPLNLTHHLSQMALSFTPSRLKSLYKYFYIPGMVNLAGGLPYPGYFPIDNLHATVASSDSFAEDMTSKLFSMLKSSKKQHFDIPKFNPPHGDPLNDVYLAKALQYGTCEGMPALLSFVKDFAINYQHQGKIPYDSPGVIMTCGNTDGLAKAFSILAERGDKMLVEKYVYMGTVQSAVPRGIGIVPVEVDKEGMVVEGEGGLRDVLDSWDLVTDGPRPRLMYTITMGQNPTSGVLGLERRKEIYSLCQKYDIVILEDDPYWFLQFDLFADRPDNEKFLSSLSVSYITLDVDGRVLRFDTFSKSIAPGCRLGWVMGHPTFIERMLRLGENSTQMPSGAIQALVSKLLVNTWGMSGWITWLSLLREKYEERMNILCNTLDDAKEVTMIHLRNVRMRDDDGNVIEGEKYGLVHKAMKELYEFQRPMGGMFLWVRIHFEIHRLYDGTNGRDLMMALWKFLASTELLCLVCPGQVFGSTGEVEDKEAWKFFRLCFAAVELNSLKQAGENFGKGVKEFFELTELPPDDDDEEAILARYATSSAPQFC